MFDHILRFKRYIPVGLHWQRSIWGKRNCNRYLGRFPGSWFAALRGSEASCQRATVDKIVEFLKEFRKHSNIIILLHTLENIVKGGRLSKFQGSLAKILNIKVILEGIEGKVELVEKVRGTNKFLNRALEMIGEKKKDFSETVFGITHLDNRKGRLIFKGRIN